MKVAYFGARQPPSAEYPLARTESGSARRPSGGTLVEFAPRAGGPRSSASADALARATTALIAESNLAAVRSHGIDLERLLALLR